MANEPSWEDIFNPKPDSDAPDAPVAYPPTQAYPATAPAAPQAPVDDDPFAALFGTPASGPTSSSQTPPPLVAPTPSYQPPYQPTSPEQVQAYPLTQAYPADAAPAYPPTQAYPAAEQAASAPALEQDDPFAHLFGTAAPVAASAQLQSRGQEPRAPLVGSVPLTRREMRESEGRARSDSDQGASGGSGDGGGYGGGSGGNGGGNRFDKPKKKRRLLWLKITLPIVLVLAAAGSVGAYGWLNYNEQVRALLGIPLPTDYSGTGNGKEVVVQIKSGDIGSDVAVTLHEAGVTMTYDAVYDYLVENPDITFKPGNWRLQGEMSAKSAVAALQDSANKVTDELLITEGTTLPTALEIIASTTGLDLTDVQDAAKDLAAYGVDPRAVSLEGYLFPAKYELDGTETAQDILKKLVDEMYSRLDAAGVAPADRYNVLIMASIIQREAGPNEDDFYKISRVFANRIEQGINLQSDATVAYGTGRFDSVWTEPEERDDASNPYNTYANPGLPIGPIGLPGDRAIDAALHPADGPWLFFVPINLATGETVFSETAEEHQAAVDQLHAWCEASAENATYCK